MKKIVCVILSVIMIFTLAGCGSTEKEDGLKEITLVLDWTPNVNHAGIYIAKELGYFEEEGINLEIVMPPEDGAVAMVASGQAQFGIDFQDSLAAAFDSEAEDMMPVTAIAAVIQHNTTGIISLKEKNINTFKDLEGKTYASYQLPTELAVMEYAMKKDGGDFSKLDVVPGAAYDAISALSADIDSIWVYEGTEKTACELAGLDCNFMRFTDADAVFDYYTPVIIANNDFMNDNIDLERAFLSAVKKGYEYCVNNPDKAAQIFAEAVPELDAEQVKAGLEYLADEFIADAPCWGYIDSERWNRFYEWMYEQGLTEHNLKGIGFVWG